MCIYILFKVVVFIGLLVLFGCVFKVIQLDKYFGFLKNYLDLQEIIFVMGKLVLCWVDLYFNDFNYDSIVYNLIIYYFVFKLMIQVGQ